MSGRLNVKSRSPQDNKFPGEGREPLVANPKYGGGQECIMPNFEKEPHRPDAIVTKMSSMPNMQHTQGMGKRAPID